MVSRGYSSQILKIMLIICFAFVVRFLYIIYVVPIDWIGDSYHHWQISLYTLQIGTLRGRLWDLKGVEYYWPPLPSLLEAFTMNLFGDTSIIFIRLLNSLSGSICVYLSYLIGSRINDGSGVSATLILLFFPFTLNTEVLGLHEPIMGLFFLIGLLSFLSKKKFHAGVFFGLSYLCHFSVYLTVPVLLVAILWRDRKIENVFPFFIGFCLVYLPYSFILKLHTGDWFYNIRSLMTYMNISTDNMNHPLAKIFGLVLVAAGVIIFMNVRKKKCSSLEPLSNQILLGCYMFFWGILFTFNWAPLSPYELRYYWIPLTLSIICLDVYVKGTCVNIRIDQRCIHLSVIFGIISLMLLLMFSPVFSKLQDQILFDFNAADRISNYYNNGTIISPVPGMTYRLINHWNIAPKNILGPIYCPIEQNQKNQWLLENNVTIIFWLPDMEADRVFPELSDGVSAAPFILLESLGYDRYIYTFFHEYDKRE